MRKFVFSAYLIFFFCSCSTLTINQQTQRTTSKKVLLSGIGVGSELLLENKYQNTAIVLYNQPIKVLATPISFTKKTYNAFVKAREHQPTDLNIRFVDSVSQKPKFIHLQVVDKVAILEELNSDKNLEIKNYLRVKHDARMVIAISMALDSEAVNAIVEAENIFLEQIRPKMYALNLFQEKKLIRTISFDEGVVFAYKTAGFCWQENQKHRLMVVDLTNQLSICPDNTYSNAKRAEKEFDYFKF